MRQDDRSLDLCIKCTDCNAACPVMKVLPEFPGPKALGPDMERLRKEGVDCASEWPEYCLGCNRCELACPNQVNVFELVTRAKANQIKRGRKKWRDYLLARPALLGRPAALTCGFTNAFLKINPLHKAITRTLLLAPEREFPKYARRAVKIRRNGASKRVIFFPGCYIRYNDPELSSTVASLLERAGYEIEIANSSCCGVPALANGDAQQTRKSLEATIASLSADRQTPVVAACTSCAHMFKAEYPRLCGGSPQAKSLAERTYELGEFLLEFGEAPQDLQPLRLRLAYHAPCHLKGLGIGRPWLKLLRRIPGVSVEEIPAECCGMSGTYGFKREKYAISMNIGRELFAGVSALAPDLAISECATCRIQIEHGTGVKAIHPAEIFLQSLQPASRPALT